MSMYNLMYGENPYADLLLDTLGFARASVERFRDIGVTEDKELAILTRTGGGNRPDFPQKLLREHPLYLRDEDSKALDNTYAIYYFSLPEVLQKMVE